MAGELDKLTDHRLTSMEEKLEEVLGLVKQVIVLEESHKQTRTDVNAAHSMLRAHETSLHLFVQQQARAEATLREISDTAKFVADPEKGLAVRMTRMEGIQDANRSTLRYFGGILATLFVTAVIAICGFIWSVVVKADHYMALPPLQTSGQSPSYPEKQ